MDSSERYEILQDDLESLVERIEASLEWISKKTHNIGENRVVSKVFRLFDFDFGFQRSKSLDWQDVRVNWTRRGSS